MLLHERWQYIAARQSCAESGCFSSFFLARRYASVGNSDRNVSISLSVRLSRAGIVLKKDSVMISSPSGSHMILVFWCQISSRYSKRFPQSGCLNNGGVGKISSFLSLSVKAQLSLTNPRDAIACQNCSIRRVYNVVADNTGLSSLV